MSQAGVALNLYTLREAAAKDLPGVLAHVRDAGYHYESLELHMPNKRMEPFLVTFDDQNAEEMTFYSHEGEEFLFLLEGTLEYRTGGETGTIKSGDSLYLESDAAHAFRSVGVVPARALVVVCGGDKG